MDKTSLSQPVPRNGTSPSKKARFTDDHALGLGGFIIGFIGVAFGVATWILDEHKDRTLDQQCIDLSTISVALTIAALLVIAGLLRHATSVHRAFVEASREIELLTRDKRNLEQTIAQEMDVVSPAFNRLSAKIYRYEEMALTYIVSNLLPLSQESASDFEAEERFAKDFHATYLSTLEAICNTAVEVYPVLIDKKFTALKLSANIKILIHHSGKSDPYYLPQSRNSSAAPERTEDDIIFIENAKQKEYIYVNEHYIYDKIIEKTRNKLSRRHYLSNDIDSLLALTTEASEERRDRNELSYRQPTRLTANLYKSCLVVPIEFENISIKEKLPASTTDRTKLYPPVMGFFCIDSNNKDFFNEKHHVDMAYQLANHASSVMRLNIAALLSSEKSKNYRKSTTNRGVHE